MLHYDRSDDIFSQCVEQWSNRDEDQSLLDELNAQKEALGPDAVLREPRFDPLLTPFDVVWAYGFELTVPVLNLSFENRREIFYTTSNNGVLYDYCKKKMIHLKAHVGVILGNITQGKIVSVSVDKSGRWLVTLDNGQENVIVIWDTILHEVVWTIFNPSATGNREKVTLVGMSPDARLLVTVSNSDSTAISFWLWTFGEEKPDDNYTNDRRTGPPKAIEFHPNRTEHIMVVYEQAVLFLSWDHEEKKISQSNSPKIPVKHVIGHLTDGTYVDFCNECFVCTSKGNVLVFGNTLFAKNFNEDELDNKKKYIKNVKLSKVGINCITSIDELSCTVWGPKSRTMENAQVKRWETTRTATEQFGGREVGLVVTGHTNGTISFFDKRLKLLYWYNRQISAPIRSICFKQCPRKYKLEEDSTGVGEEETTILSDTIYDCAEDDRSDEYEILMEGNLPTDATLQSLPFVTRDFFITTYDGIIYAVNFLQNEFVEVFPTASTPVAAIDVHDQFPYIIVAYKRGAVVMYNYETHEIVAATDLPTTDPNSVITCIKYSTQCLHLACGKSNGELWLLQPAMLAQIYVEPFRFSTNKIEQIVFSSNSLQMAYYDSNMTVFGFFYDTDSEDWMFKGKLRSHYKEIVSILFLDEPPYSLFTIGKDRHIIQYTDISANDEDIDILIRERIDQRDIPTYFITYPRQNCSKTGYFLVSDNKVLHKFKIIAIKTNMCVAVYLGPAYGCFKGKPVVRMEFLPLPDKRYLVFMTKTHIGLQLMPIDGNPYRFIGCAADPEELADFRVSFQGEYVFTIGADSSIIFQWKVKTLSVMLQEIRHYNGNVLPRRSVETMFKLGGVELQPFYCLLEGGRNGYHYQEMHDLFYYMQILQQGEQVPVPRIVSNKINLGELPDLVRACGYYPSEYEIENLLTDLRYKEFDETGAIKDKATFCEFVKAFINHKPAHGYTVESLEDSFRTVVTFGDRMDEITKDDFIEAITTSGEQVTNDQIYKCLATLCHTPIVCEQGVEKDYSFLPDTIDFDTFTEDLLGLSMEDITREPADENSTSFDYYGY